MSVLSRLCLLLPGFLPVLSGCAQKVNEVRADRFVNQPQLAVEARPSAVGLNLHTTPNGQSFTTESLARLNKMLRGQGRLRNQTITLMPSSPAAERIAGRLAKVLKKHGLPSTQLHVKAASVNGPTSADEDKNGDLLVISEAIVAKIPECSIADPDIWTISPYRAVGTLGCANRANIARMVSDPRDLIRPRKLAPGDGVQAGAAVQRYHTDDVRELIDIDFSED